VSSEGRRAVHCLVAAAGPQGRTVFSTQRGVLVYFHAYRESEVFSVSIVDDY
jgi:hypothetical protein